MAKAPEIAAIAGFRAALGGIFGWAAAAILFADAVFTPLWLSARGIGMFKGPAFGLFMMTNFAGLAVICAVVLLGVGRLILGRWKKLQLVVCAVLLAVVVVQILGLHVVVEIRAATEAVDH